MVNGKKLLASVLVGAMVITGSPVAPAWSVASVEASTTDAYTVTLDGTGNTWNDITTAIDAVADGSVLKVTGEIKTQLDITVGKKLTIDFTGANYESEPTVTGATSPTKYCVNNDKAGVYVVDEHEIVGYVCNWSADWTSAKFTDVCKNGCPQTEKKATVTDTSTATCTKAGEIIKTATYGETYTDEKKKESGALGHDYKITKCEVQYVDAAKTIVKKDVNGNPIVKVTVNCARGSKHDGAEPIEKEVSATLVKDTATCNNPGDAYYNVSVEVEGKTLTLDEKNDENLIKLLSAKTEKHVASKTPVGIKFKKVTPAEGTNPEKEEWLKIGSTFKFADATADEKGNISYKVLYKCETETCETEVEGVAETLSPVDSTKDKCNVITYTYGKITRPLPDTDNESRTLFAGGQQKDQSEATHSLDADAIGDEKIKVIEEPTCLKPGKKQGRCTVCGDTKAIVPISAKGHNYKTENPVKGEDYGTKEATCTTPGYEYKKCNNANCDYKDAPYNYLVPQSEVIPATDHEFAAVLNDFNVKTSPNATINEDSEGNVTNVVLKNMHCYKCGADINVTYHLKKASDTDVKNDVNVYDAFDVVETKGNCLTKGSKKYTFKNVKKADGSALSFEKEDKDFGAHDYKATNITWTDNGKTARATLECQNTKWNEITKAYEKCTDNVITKACKVSSKDSTTNGSTTYTATLEGYDLTNINDTKTVYDLSKAEVTAVEDMLDSAYESFFDDTDTFDEANFIKALNVVVKINTAEISKDLYSVEVKDANTGLKPTKTSTTIKVTVKNKGKDVVEFKEAAKTVAIVNDSVGVSAKAYINGEDIKTSYTYGKDLAFTVKPDNDEYTVVYKVATEVTDENDVTQIVGKPIYKADYKQTPVVLTDAGNYVVYWACKDKAGVFTGYGETYVVIEKAKSDFKAENMTAPYTGKGIELAYTTSSNGEVSVRYYDSDWNRIPSAPVEPGKYIAYVYQAEGNNYNDSEDWVTYFIEITKAETKISVENKTVTYNGKSVSSNPATVVGSTGDVTYTYYADKDCVEKLAGAPINVGTYYVVASVEADDHYKAAKSNVAEIVIEAAEPTEPETTELNLYAPIWADANRVDGIVTYFTYGADPTDAVLYTNVNGKKVKLVKDVDYTIEIDSKNAGTREVTVKGIGKYTGSDVFPVVIEKKAVTITLPSVSNTTTALPSGYKATVAGVVAGDNLNVKPVLAGSVIKATYDANANYDVKVVEGKLTVVKPAPKAQSITTKKLTASYKVATVKKAAKTFSIGATCTSKKAVTAKKVSGSSKIAVSKDGKVKIAKGTKKGTYTAKVKLSAPATSSYKAASKTVTVKVTVK